MMRLRGKTAVVTGGGSGIGEAMARRFSAEGAAVAVFDRDLAAAERVAGELEGGGGRALAVGCDVADERSVGEGFEEVASALGGRIFW